MRAITLALGLLVVFVSATASGQSSGGPDELSFPTLLSNLFAHQVEPSRGRGFDSGQRRAVTTEVL